MSAPVPVAWIGLGAMGMPMASHLVRSGFPVVGYDPAPTLRFPEDVSIRTAASPAAAADGASVVVVMVATPAQAEAALLGADGVLAGLREGATVVVTATIGPESATALATAVAEAGGAFVDAPVSGGVARAGSGELLVMVGADEAAFGAARPVLDALGATVHHVGPRPGDGQRMKLVNQLLCGVHIAVAAEALAYAERLGIDPAAALEVLGGGAAASFMLGDRGPRMVSGEFEPPRSAVDIFVKDLGLVLDADPDAALPLARAARGRFVQAADAGMGRLDDSSLIRLPDPGRREGAPQ